MNFSHSNGCTFFKQLTDVIEIYDEAPKSMATPLQPASIICQGHMTKRQIAHKDRNSVTEAIYDFLSRTEVMVLICCIFAPLLFPEEGLKFPLLRVHISGFKAKSKNHLSGAISMVMSYVSLPFMPMVCEQCGLQGGCHQFCCLLLLHQSLVHFLVLFYVQRFHNLSPFIGLFKGWVRLFRG